MRLDEFTAPVTADWLDAAGVRRAATRRRRRKQVLTAAIIVAVAVGVAVPVSLHDDPSHAPVATDGGQIPGAMELVAHTSARYSPDPAAAEPIVGATNQLTLDLLRQLGPDAAGKNLSVSASSLATALAMLQNGARGRTLTEMRHVLHTSGLTSEQQDAGWAALTDAWSHATSDKVTLETANSIFLQQGLPVEQPFLAALDKYYRAGVWTVDFRRNLDQAVAAINAWTTEKTHGRITKLFEDGALDEYTRAVLADAIYFKAAWQTAFDPKRTRTGRFTTDGGTTSAKFMQTDDHGARIASSEKYQAAELPYAGGRFAALAVMPTTGSLADFVNGLTAGGLSGIVASLHDNAAGSDIYLPKFTTESNLDLGGALQSLGMPTAFSDVANFEGFTPEVKIGTVQQRVYLSVSETGTEAAAVTGVGIEASSAGLELRFDRPFLFLVRDTETGAIMFASQIQKPGA